MISWITEPLSYGFMQKAMIGIILASINCAMIGTYIVVRRMSFLSEALTHTLLPGVVFAYLRGMHLFLGALLSSLVTALGIGIFTSRRGIRQDSAIGVALTFMFALGVLMMSLVNSFRDFSSILFGSVLGVTHGDLILTGIVTAIVLISLFLLHKELELSSFDPLYADFVRIGKGRMRYLILVIISLSVVTAVQMIGALLSTALLITPAATSLMWAKTLKQAMLAAIGVGIFSGVAGLLLSYHLEVSSGASVVLFCSIMFILSWVFRAIRGQ
jgi:manganese/iron transport system permease protein